MDMNQLTDKPLLRIKDIQERYQCGRDAAYRIIREVKAYNGGGKLGVGKILPIELERWENGK